MSIGLYGNGMHNFVLDELELGSRAARAYDDEAIGLGSMFDLDYWQWAAKQPGFDGSPAPQWKET